MPIEEDILPWRPCSSHWGCFKCITPGGIATGLSFLLYELLAFLLLSRHPALPLKLFAAALPGRASVVGEAPAVDTLLVGIVSVFVLSSVCSFLLVVFLAQVPRLAASTPALVTTACAYGYVLWVIDFLLIFHLGLPRDLMRGIHPGIHGFTGHVFFYGMVLGFYLDFWRKDAQGFCACVFAIEPAYRGGEAKRTGTGSELHRRCCDSHQFCFLGAGKGGPS